MTEQAHLTEHHPILHCEQKMMQFRLRTLLIVLALGPILLAATWLHWEMRLLLLVSFGTLAMGIIAAWLSETIIAR